MTKSRSEAVKRHFTEVGDSGRVDKGNKQRRCNFCDKLVSGAASRARDHLVKGSRCDVERLRGVVPREEYSRRVKGRLAARSELGVVMGETAKGGSSEDDNEQRTVEGREVDRSESAAGLLHATPQSSIGASAYYGILKTAIEEIGAEAVVGVVMDNAAVCAAVGRMVEADHPHIFSVPCTTHSLDLIFESFAKITWVGEVIKRVSEVAKFFTNLSGVRDLLLHCSNGSVVPKPGATRFTTNFIMLSSLQGLYLPLRACLTDDDWKPTIVHTSQHELFVRVTHSIFDDTFWVDIEKVMQTSRELLKLLKMVDGTGPTISKVYARVDSVVEKLRESRHFTEEVDAEVCSWIEGIGQHTSENARTQARTMQPARWWRKWCSDMPILQKQAVRLLGQGCSSSSCERNWNLFERIHSRLRNNLGTVKLSTLVFNRWNQHLLDFLTKKQKADDAAKWEEDEPVEDLTRDEMASNARLRLGEWRARLRGTHSVHDEGENDDSGSDEEDIPVQVQQTAVAEEVTVKHRDKEVEDVDGGDSERVAAPVRATRKRGRLRKAAVEEEEAENRRGTRKRGRLQVQPAEEEEEEALEKTSSADKNGSRDGSSNNDESSSDDGSGGSRGARDGSSSSNESGGGRGSSDGGEKDGRLSKEEDDSECEGQ
ncbi:hypothetical protein CBR_g55432 [Chara braunii]|uniref:DUF659 domain-containing protein n=1 Tax=Chara braunii TaxID=69332 RepID=A0A388K7U1_CHABU|nr:hypothetical protein CBR_g55432 [Chara braunii]|eukprot:GBG66089.1 hypothetical protein CBR_g55432 [Chara braunii]